MCAPLEIESDMNTWVQNISFYSTQKRKTKPICFIFSIPIKALKIPLADRTNKVSDLYLISSHDQTRVGIRSINLDNIYLDET